MPHLAMTGLDYKRMHQRDAAAAEWRMWTNAIYPQPAPQHATTFVYRNARGAIHTAPEINFDLHHHLHELEQA